MPPVEGPSLAILRYGVTASYPMPRTLPLDPTARGRVVVGGPYGFVGSCSACPQKVLFHSFYFTHVAIRQHLRKHL